MVGELFGVVGGKRHLEEGKEGRGEFGLAVGAVDEDSHGLANAGAGVDEIEGLGDAAPAGDHILDEEQPFARFNLKIPAQGKRVVVFFGEEEAFAELAGDLLPDDQATHGRGDDGLDLRHIGQALDEEFGEARHLIEMLTDPCALEKMAGAQTGAEDKVAFEEGTGVFENRENFFLVGIHGRGKEQRGGEVERYFRMKIGPVSWRRREGNPLGVCV